MCSLRLDVLDKKKELPRKIIKLAPEDRLTSKLRINPANNENPVDLWYFTHT